MTDRYRNNQQVMLCIELPIKSLIRKGLPSKSLLCSELPGKSLVRIIFQNKSLVDIKITQKVFDIYRNTK